MTLTPQERKEKAKWARIKRVYGITKEQYDKLDLGFCPICLRDWSANVRPVVDHDHGGNGIRPYVRGIVCMFCNHYRIGRLRDYELVQRIADYLQNAPRNLIVPEKKKKKRRTRGKNPSSGG